MGTVKTIQSALLSGQTGSYLNNLSVNLVNNDVEWNYNKSFPVVRVQQPNGKFYVYNNVRQNTPDNDLITEESAPNRIGSYFSEDTYTTEKYALRYFITSEMMEYIGSALDLVRNAGEAVTGSLMAGAEARFVKQFFDPTTSIWTNKVTGGTAASNYGSNTVMKWSNAASTPLEDIEHYSVQYMLLSRGHRANAAIMSRDVFSALINHPDIAPRLTPSGQDPRTKDVLKRMLAVLLDIENIRVIDSIYNAAPDGVTDGNGNPPEDYRFMSTGMFFLYNYTPTAGLRTSAPAVMFDYAGPLNGGFNGGYPVFRSYKHWDGGIEGVFIEGRLQFGMKVANPRNAILFSGLV